MSTVTANALLIYEDEVFRVEQCATCLVPGYLVVEVMDDVSALAELPVNTSMRLGITLARTSRAIDRVLHPERVYCLLFAEAHHAVHFHLFPRSRWLLNAFRTAKPGAAVSGPAIFDWARSTFGPGAEIPAEAPDLLAVCRSLRKTLCGLGGRHPA